jgi:hypothetical protein
VLQLTRKKKRVGWLRDASASDATRPHHQLSYRALYVDKGEGSIARLSQDLGYLLSHRDDEMLQRLPIRNPSGGHQPTPQANLSTHNLGRFFSFRALPGIHYAHVWRHLFCPRL